MFRMGPPTTRIETVVIVSPLKVRHILIFFFKLQQILNLFIQPNFTLLYLFIPMFRYYVYFLRLQASFAC